MGKGLNLLLGLLLAVSVLVPGLSGCTPSEAAPEVGRRAPDFELSDLNGQSVSLSDFRGQQVLLNFWATWCGPCRFEMPFLEQVHREQSADGLVVLGVNIGETTEEVEQFAADFGLSFTVLLDSDQQVALMYNVRSIPTTLLIDKDGIIRDRKIGAFATLGEIESDLDKIR